MVELKKVDYYWSDRWQKVINIYKCKSCGKEFSDLDKTKPALQKDHDCNQSMEPTCKGE